MSKITVPVEVSKEAHELAKGVAAFIATVWPKLKDGFQIADAGVLISAVVALTPALKGVELIPGEAVEDPGAFAMTGAVLLAEIVKAIRA